MKQNRFLRFLSRIWIRLLAFNVLLVFLPAAGLVYLASYEEELLFSQEDAMAQEGRLLAATLSSSAVVDGKIGSIPQEPPRLEALDSKRAQQILQQLNRRSASRLRVVDPHGNVVADSVRQGPQRQEIKPGPVDPTEPALRDDRIYRFGSWLYRLYEGILGRRDLRKESEDGSQELLQRREIRKALAGEYGAASRPTPGQRSLTLHSALPIEQDGEVVGVVVVSRTTLRLLRSLYAMRLKIFRIFLASVAAAVVLSLLVGTTIAGPLRRLRQQAHELLDRRGRLRGRFRDSGKLDEIGDLARALEELTRRLEEHISFIEAFASDVSHEFKNPLASIRSAAETAAEATEPKDQKRFLAMIQSQVARMEHLLSAARDLTHLDAQLEQEERSTVDLPRLLEDIIEGFRLRGTERVRFSSRLAQDEACVLAAPERLAQVFENLLDNAVSYSPTDGEVRIALRRSGPSVIVEVEDDGPGIPEQHLEKIFTRFFSYRPQSDSIEHHHGLGLAVVKAIVNGYGGEITAENRPQGGARFRLELPVEPAAAGP
ncbi:MAG: stimulus-sensing domain-containing protein [Deltaproteobacteria bacterium]|nr:stimulus-sensing domain-containing protein [Deltaproteobacteria bacterium]